MPADPGSAPKGQSFWRYLPRDLTGSLRKAWRFECNRLTRRHLPVWHYTNPFWRYVLETAAWYVLVYWMGGPWVLLIFAVLCFGVITSMKIINYVQHYGLRRIRMRDGRFEGIHPRHSWSAAGKVANLLHYNMQRHPDHHIAPNRHYPLLQHHGESEGAAVAGQLRQDGWPGHGPPALVRDDGPAGRSLAHELLSANRRLDRLRQFRLG